MVGGQLFGLPIARVQDVFMPDHLTRVPLAPPEIAGVLNLRGRIVTAIDMRCRLGLPKREEGASHGGRHRLQGRILWPRDRFDRRGAQAADDSREDNPVNLDAGLARVRAGVHRLDRQLLVVLDVERVLDMKPRRRRLKRTQ